MNIILFFLAIYSIIDIIGEDNTIKIVFKSIISFFSFIPVFFSLYFLLKNPNLKVLYIVQQTMLYINANWANDVINRINKIKGCDYEDNLVKRIFIDYKYNIVINPKKIYMLLNCNKSIYLEKYYFIIKYNKLFFKNVIEKGELIEENNYFFISSDNHKLSLLYKMIKIFNNYYYFYIIDIPITIKKYDKEISNKFIYSSNSLIYCNPYNNIKDIEEFLTNDFYYIINLPGKFYDGTIYKMNIKDKILYLNLTNYLEKKEIQNKEEPFIEINNNFILKLKNNKITRIFNEDIEFVTGYYWI